MVSKSTDTRVISQGRFTGARFRGKNHVRTLSELGVLGGIVDSDKERLKKLSGEYPGISFIDVNVDENGSLADAFYVNGIPQMDLIVRKNPDGSYLYVDIEGKAIGDRKKSAIVGYREKEALKTALDAAVRARG